MSVVDWSSNDLLGDGVDSGSRAVDHFGLESREDREVPFSPP